METPVGRSRTHTTPGSGRRRSAIKTPKSVLTPNDDAAEKASIRRKRRSEALRLSLSDAFAGQADQHKQQQAGDRDSRPQLTEEQCAVLLEQCLKLATENKITDRNAWHLQLISYLPDIVGSGSSSRARGGSSSYNFQKMSGGLDAGVTIFSKRVDLTYKEALSLGSYAPAKLGDGADDGGCEGEDGEEADDLEDAAATAAKAQKQKGRGKQPGGSADEAATLTTPEQLRAKKGDTTLAVDPLFHTMSALFDEGGAKGLLLLNRSVYDGAHIMTSPHDLPEQQFPLQAPPQQDALLDLRPLQQQLAACSSSSTSQASAAVLTPGLPQLYELLEQTRRTLPGGNKQQQQLQQQQQPLDVAAVMQQALYRLPPIPMPRPISSCTGAGSQSAGPAAAVAAAAAAAADAVADTDMADGSSSSPTGISEQHSSGAGLWPGTSGLPVVASFLAETAAEDEAAAAAAAAAGADNDEYGDGGYGPEGGYDADDGDCGHPGFEDDGDVPQEQQQGDRRQSLLGLGAEQAAGAGEDSCLDAEALQQLLGAASGRKGATTSKGGWAGSRFWMYSAAAAATARMASGGGSEPVKRAAAGGAGGRSRSAAAARLDFTQRPADLEAALAPGSRKQTCLVAAPTNSSSSSGNSGNTGTLLPEDLHYQASNLLQLFLRPAPISFGRHRQQHGSGSSRANGAEQLPSWAEEPGGDADGGWGGDGYSDLGGYGDEGADGYNAGDLSMGDPGFNHSEPGAAGSSSSSGEWWSADGELLSAPKRMTARCVSYQRSAKQVDVRALKDLLWDSLVQVNTQHTEAPQTTASAAAAAAGDPGVLPMIPFEDIIAHVPQESAAGSLQDVSVHMCFICLLHLANEKGLVVKAQEDLRTLTISNVQGQEQQA